jgi:hypothetical protein
MKKLLLGSIFFIALFALPHAAKADIILVGTTTAAGSSVDYAMSLTALKGGVDTRPRTGDIVIVVTSFSSTSNQDPGVTTAGYTEVADLYDDDTNDTNTSVNYKVMIPGPDTTVTCKSSKSTTFGATCLAMVFRGEDQANPLDVTTVTAVGGGGGEDINCPSITTVTPNALVLCTGGAAGANVPAAGASWPTNYGQIASSTIDPAGTASFSAGTFRQIAAPAAEDPAAFALDMGTAAQNSWAAATMALRPALPNRHMRLFQGFRVIIQRSGILKVL